MGIFHCISSDCAEVRYRPYEKKDGIRYRYPGKEWITVDGDDYEIEEKEEGCRWEELTRIETYYYYLSPESNIRIKQTGVQFDSDTVYQSHTWDNVSFYVTRTKINGDKISKPIPVVHNQRRYLEKITYRGAKLYDKNNERVYLDDPSDKARFCSPKKCIFKVFNLGKTILEIETEDCPEVQLFNGECKLSDRYQVVQAKKKSYLERVEIRSQSIEGYGLGGQLIDASPLSPECLNIYKTFVAAPPFLSNFVPTAGIFNPYEFVAQICSDKGCPPPEYTVVCNCGEKCPENTCPVLCGNQICCHDPTTGNAVYSIPIGKYSGDYFE